MPWSARSHTDQALALIDDASADERAVLAASLWRERGDPPSGDPRLMPKRKPAWAAWNVLRASGEGDRPVMDSYWMNRLQGIDDARPLFVTLTPRIAPSRRICFSGGSPMRIRNMIPRRLPRRRRCRAFRSRRRVLCRCLDGLRLPRGWPACRPSSQRPTRLIAAHGHGRAAPACPNARWVRLRSEPMAPLFPPPPDAALFYVGSVMHARMKPKAHRFTYSVFALLVDLDRLEEAHRLSPFFSVGIQPDRF